MKSTLYIKLLLLLLIGFTSACDTFTNKGPAIPQEAIKEIDGTWKIVQATRNGADITALMDFTQFRIHFNSDKTFTIDHYLPFVVQSNGTWDFDDPQFPFNLQLTQADSGVTLTTAFNYPVVDGVRRIALSFSPGCQKNIYIYLFEKETSEN